jgi:hypothetical protein
MPFNPSLCAIAALVARILLACALLVHAQALTARVAEPGGPAQLSARHAALADRLARNQYARPLYLESSESPRDVSGEVYALFDYPFTVFSTALRGAREWCDVLLLHVNTKHCRAVEENGRTVLDMGLGAKAGERDTHRMRLDFGVARSAPDYFTMQLHAQTGPLATSDYRILVEAVPVGDGRTFIHLTYSYSYGAPGRLAMQAYLATSGRGKVGFTVVGQGAGGAPEYVSGVRGAVERNVMRYYLALDAYLGALRTPESERMEKRLNAWFSATEQYPRQLREISRAAYLEMKRSEYQRQAYM